MRRHQDKREPDPVARVVTGWPERSCCCTASPVVKVVMPPAPDREHGVDLYLCGHHYRVSLDAIARTGATVDIHPDKAMASLVFHPTPRPVGALR